MSKSLVEVAVRSPLRRLFTYESDAPLAQGTRVRVPFGRREVLGVVWRTAVAEPQGLKRISKILDQAPMFGVKDLEFYQKASDYYGVSLGELLNFSIPKRVADGKPLKEVEPKKFKFNLLELSPQQAEVVDEVLSKQDFTQHLLLGETGSGKTEVYLHVFKKVYERGGQSLFLVPEIALTPQFEQRMKERLGAEVSVFHSQLKESRREECFALAASGKPGIFLGTRSALFLPFKNLQTIVVDEEHDNSYKQNERGCYNARDLAIWKAQMLRIPIVMGSATPSLETYERMKSQNLPIHRLKPFFKTPDIKQEVVDLKAQFKDRDKSFISPVLHEALIENLTKGEQSLLFLNRRGSASQRLCTSCGQETNCQHCSTTLTVHRDRGVAICHWCGFQQRLSQPCRSCGNKEFFEGGIGTKEVEMQIKARFPDARVARLDRDETAQTNKLAEVIEKFSQGKIDILIGTQMISKGIDIPKLSLLGVILADQGWGVPDFRGMERSFQLLKQLRGRVGRRGQDSRFIIQTFQKDHPLFASLEGDDAFEKFAQGELAVRWVAELPPYKKLTLWTLSHKSESVVRQSAETLKTSLDRMGTAYKLLNQGPTPAPMSRWKGYYRYQILSRSDAKTPTTALITSVLDAIDRKPLKAKLKLDRDPYHFL